MFKKKNISVVEDKEANEKLKARVLELEKENSRLNQSNIDLTCANIDLQNRLNLSQSLNDKLCVDLQNKLQQLIDLEINNQLVKETFATSEDVKNLYKDDPDFHPEILSKFIDYDIDENKFNFPKSNLARIKRGEYKVTPDGTLYKLYAVNFFMNDDFYRAYLFATKDNVNERFESFLYKYLSTHNALGAQSGRIDAAFQCTMSLYNTRGDFGSFKAVLDFTNMEG